MKVLSHHRKQTSVLPTCADQLGELFTSKNFRLRSRVVKYVRFNNATDAIRLAIEQLPADVFLGAYLETNDQRYDSRGIHRLYDHPEYPLPRLAQVA
jgi:hypothetical protein